MLVKTISLLVDSPRKDIIEKLIYFNMTNIILVLMIS